MDWIPQKHVAWLSVHRRLSMFDHLQHGQNTTPIKEEGPVEIHMVWWCAGETEAGLWIQGEPRLHEELPEEWGWGMEWVQSDKKRWEVLRIKKNMTSPILTKNELTGISFDGASCSAWLSIWKTENHKEVCLTTGFVSRGISGIFRTRWTQNPDKMREGEGGRGQGPEGGCKWRGAFKSKGAAERSAGSWNWWLLRTAYWTNNC